MNMAAGKQASAGASSDTSVSFSAWDEAPADIQGRIVDHLDLKDAARAACVSKSLYARIACDPRWALLHPEHGNVEGQSSYRRASRLINHLIGGPRSRAAVGKMLAAEPLLPLLDVNGCSEYLVASVKDALLAHDEDLARFAAAIFLAHRQESKTLSIPCRNRRTLPETLGVLTGLRELHLLHCESLVALPESLTKLTALQTLTLHGCSKKIASPLRCKQTTVRRDYCFRI